MEGLEQEEDRALNLILRVLRNDEYRKPGLFSVTPRLSVSSVLKGFRNRRPAASVRDSRSSAACTAGRLRL